MSHDNDELTFSTAQFSGTARLFPLPNLVLFPHVIQPLHIFEPRYVAMFRSAIEQDRLIGMALLRPGWEDDYEGRPPVESIACLGRILNWQAVPGNRYNLLLLGVRRIRIVRELPPRAAYREARAEIVEDCYPCPTAAGRAALQRELVTAFEAMLPRLKDAQELFQQLSVDTISLGALTDVISYSLDLTIADKQELLAETDVDRRAQTLIVHLRRACQQTCPASLSAGFPPSFSAN